MTLFIASLPDWYQETGPIMASGFMAFLVWVLAKYVRRLYKEGDKRTLWWWVIAIITADIISIAFLIIMGETGFNLLVLTLPLTSSVTEGVVVPIPTFPAMYVALFEEFVHMPA